jgi:hypothetical protein
VTTCPPSWRDWIPAHLQSLMALLLFCWCVAVAPMSSSWQVPHSLDLQWVQTQGSSGYTVTKERPAFKKNLCMLHKKGKLVYPHSIYSFHNVFTKLSSWMTGQALFTSRLMHLCRLDQKQLIRISFTNISLITSGNGIRCLQIFKFTNISYY